MTVNRIKKVALTHFANKGYDGASLADIADEVGIKKPSIYAHFKGKDDLFLKVIEGVAKDELNFVIDLFQTHKNHSLQDLLYQFLIQYKERYENDDITKLWLRMAFFPPTHMHEQVMDFFYVYLEKVEGLLIPIFDHAIVEKEICSIGGERATLAFMCLLDGVLVEMLYGGPERFEKRLNASWYLYWRGLSNNNF
jgi:AcrR family transcriptional regulator